MKASKKIFVSIFTVSLFFSTQTKADQKNNDIEYFFDKLFISKMVNRPQWLSEIGLFESVGMYDHNEELDDVSPYAMKLDLEEQKKNFEILKKYSINDLSEEQKISYKVFLNQLEREIEGKNFLFHNYRINHMFGILSALSQVFTQYHQLKEEYHAELYLTRLSRIPEQLKQSIEFLEHQKSLGIIPPKFTVSKTIELIEKMIPKKIIENVFYSHLTKALENIKTENKKDFLKRAKKIIKGSVYPAYKELKKYLKKLLKKAKTNDGVWALPNGDEYYAYKLKEQTTTDLTANQIHELGHREVAKVQKEIQKILKKEKIKIEDLIKDPKYYYPQNDTGRKDCLKDYENILKRAKEKLYPLFDIKPKSEVIMQAVAEHEEGGISVPHYCPPNIDGSRPGMFFVNLGCLGEQPKFLMETVAVHEAEPGHHFQISLQVESDLPILQKASWHTAHGEGWALYAERLAYEQDFFSTPLDKLGNLLDDLLRGVRLVVDTGIHNKRWTFDQAVEYMKKNTGYPEELIQSEIERYFLWPAQACSYKIGQLKILELRQRAKDALGKNFDIKEFHNVILKSGSVPLKILEEVVDQYIENSK